MRSLPLLAATTVILALATGCGDNGQGIDPPVANFTQTCTDLSCTFTDASTGDITAWAWDFGDPNSGASNTSNLENPVHIFSAANTAPGYSVRLTVTDRSGTTNTITKSVTVSGGTTGGNPTASFDAPVCTGLSCSFHSTSTDVAPGTIVSTEWNFGETGSATNTASGIDAQHTYAAAGTYTVTLTVTDNEGLTGTTTQQVTVTGPSTQACTTAGTFVNCTLTLTQRSTVTVTLTAADCQLNGNQVRIEEPLRQVLFFNGCDTPEPGTPAAQFVVGPYDAGTDLVVQFRQGTAGPGSPAPGAPSANVGGTYPNWTIDIDDGGNPSEPPDFDDLVLTVEATAAP
jgi:PKD repeat protein